MLEWAVSVDGMHGRVDVLYANAAATRFAALEDISYEDWTWNFRHEVDAVFLPVRHFWPLLSKASQSAVILVGSTAGVTGSVTNGRLAHTATKGSVVAMTKQLAAEGAPRGIRVNCVSPGMIRTDRTVVITGANGGQGLAETLMFARAGGVVIATG